MPFFFEAAILSRILSPVTSRSNWANDRRILRVSRPIEVVVLNCWVTETKEAPLASKVSTILAKWASFRATARDQPLQGRPLHAAARISSIVVAGHQHPPALMHLAADERFTRFALRIERVEGLFQTLFRRLPRVDGTTHHGFSIQTHWASCDLAFADSRLIPKNSGPDHRVPV